MAMVVNSPPSRFLAGELTARIDKPQIKMYGPAPGRPRASNSSATTVPFKGTPLTENRVISFLITVYSPTQVAKVGAKRVRMSVLLQKSLPARSLKFNTNESPEREISIHFYHLPLSIFTNNVIKRTAEGTQTACLYRNHSHITEIRLENKHSRV